MRRPPGIVWWKHGLGDGNIAPDNYLHWQPVGPDDHCHNDDHNATAAVDHYGTADRNNDDTSAKLSSHNNSSGKDAGSNWRYVRVLHYQYPEQ